MIIYKCTCLITNKVYIGKTVGKLSNRKYHHLYDASHKDNTYFHNTIRKYGKENFLWEIVDSCNTANDLSELEKHYIKLYNCVRPDGMNLTFGGDGTLGCKQSLKNKKKASIRMMGENNPNRKNSPWNKGQTLSKEITNNMSLAQKNRPPESFKRGEEHHWFGKKHTEETKELMRKSALERENKKRMEAKNG